MMKQSTTTIGIRVFICALALSTLWCCHEGGDQTPPHIAKKVPCTNVTDCVGNLEAGVCADNKAPKCVAVDAGTDAGECLYGFKASQYCVCVEGTAKICNYDAGVFGVQMCDALTDASTQWGYCQSLNP